jgi:protein-disulfide isomerase
VQRQLCGLVVLVTLLAALPSFAQSPAPASPSPDEGKLLKTTEAYVRFLFAWGPDFDVKLGPLAPSISPEFYTVPLHVSFGGHSDSGVVYVSKDGKTFMRGDFFSMSSDVFADTRAKLHPDGNPSKGPADARVTIVEFSDFECPHCQQFYRTLKNVEPNYPQVRIVFKDFPLVAVHPWALTAALGARCAYMQSPEAFWLVHDAIFENQEIISAENVWDKTLEFAARAGLDKEAVKACMSGPDAKKAVETNVTDGTAVQVDSTPSVFVNGRPVNGGDEAALRQYIEYELKSQPGPAPGSTPAPKPKP